MKKTKSPAHRPSASAKKGVSGLPAVRSMSGPLTRSGGAASAVDGGASFGSGVSRVLSALDRQFGMVVWQKGKPPLDSELNLMSQLDWERMAQYIRSTMPSGFLMDPTRSRDDFETNPLWTNLFVLGRPKNPVGAHETGELEPSVWANVNGWIVPVAGTNVTDEDDIRNWIKLYPPPESDSRVDFVFLEVWQSSVGPNPSTANKPSASKIWKYGNVQFGGTNLEDDLEDPTIGFETTERVQVQYRLRVFGQGVGLGAGLALDQYPDGLDDPNLLGQGAAADAVAGFQFANMREELGDPGLWRAGDGDPTNDLGTVDGYTYAIPVCAVFRRNSNVYVAVTASGNPNQNGAFERNPGAKFLVDSLEGSRVLLQATLADALSPTDGVDSDVTLSVANLNGSGLEDEHLVLDSVFLVIEGEIIGVSEINASDETITIPAGGRGRWGTAAVGHPASAKISFFNSQAEGKFSDEVHIGDILDLRHAVQPEDWDFQRLLEHNVAALVKGELHSSWKDSAVGDTEGVVVHEVDYLFADGETDTPNHTEELDGPDGIRTIWSDAATIQPDVTVLLDNEATTDSNGVGLSTADQFDSTVRWDVGADLRPVGFLNQGGSGLTSSFTNGSTVFLYIGGEDGTGGARGTFRDGSSRAVRFVMPREFWKTGYPNVDASNGNQHPITLRFLGARAHEPVPPNISESERHPGPMYPWRDSNFEKPFIVLGGLLNSSLKVTGVASADMVNDTLFEIDVGQGFDSEGTFYSLDTNGDFETDAANVAMPLLRGQRTLFDMLTDYGRDRTGASSEVYVVVYGDGDSINNNGAFKVVGAGTVGYTHKLASNATSIVVEPLSSDFSAFDTDTGNTMTVEFRSQYHNSDDTSDYAARTADLAIVLTDIGGLSNHPWNATTLGEGEDYDNAFDLDGDTNRVAVAQKLLVSTTLLYHPGHSGMARVPDEVVRVAAKSHASDYLQQNPAVIDTTFSSASGMPEDETPFVSSHIQTWNRLPALGWHAPLAPNYGGNVVGFTEVDREAQVFYDKGSKTLCFRPFRDREMTLHSHSWNGVMGSGECLLGGYAYETNSVPKDGLQIFTGDDNEGKKLGFPVPREFMPRFGRQDIPYYQDVDAGTGTFLPGINHLFTDKADVTNPVFNIIGGRDNVSAGNQVTMFYFVTGTPTDYGTADTVIGGLNLPNIEARKTTDIDTNVQYADQIVSTLKAVNSSDFGRGLKGIQFPPHYGPARIMGVYERANFLSKGGRTFKSNRYEVDTNPATNLLREDAKEFTLFLLQNGGKDLTGEDGDHTYILPSHVLDVTRIPTYADGDAFEDFEYVVVCTVFGFAKGWVNENNLVLARKHNGQGVLRTDAGSYELEGVNMVIPCPAGNNDHLYVAYSRTVYQGDVFGSRNGSTRVTSDYEHRYGQIPMASQNALRTAVQQYDAAGDFLPLTPNPRAFQVLASMDFLTTLGTGKVGGQLYAGTALDVGYTEPAGASRMPLSEDDPAWRVVPRAFTEGQKNNTSRAKATLEILDSESINNANLHGDAFNVTLDLLDGTQTKLYFSREDFDDTLDGQGVSAESIVRVLPHESEDTRVFLAEGVNFGTVSPSEGGTYKNTTITSGTYDELAGIKATDTWSVKVTPRAVYSNDHGDVVFTGYVLANNQVRLQAHFTTGWGAFESYDDSDGGNVRSFTLDFPNIAAQSSSILTVAWAGVNPGTANYTVLVTGVSLPSGLVATAEVTAVDEITARLHNYSSGAINQASTAFKVAVFKDLALADWDIALTDVDLNVEITRMVTSKQQVADALVSTINAHTELRRTVRAFNDGTPKVTLEAIPVGAEGNGIKVSLAKEDFASVVSTTPVAVLGDVFKLFVPSSAAKAVGAVVTSTHLMGGVDLPVNAGNGTSQLKLTGMTERLPLGILLQDHDFLCENPLGDNASAMRSSPSGLAPIQTTLPLTQGGDEYTRFLGAPGELIGMTDGAILAYGAYTSDTPSGTKKFRIYRGGGSVFVLHGMNPGGPVDWVSGSFPASLRPVLKGGVLVCRALLVRNFYEEAFSAEVKMSDGDEIQMVLLTYGILGDGTSVENGLNLGGIISPTGYGEGYAAADRFRLEGRPLLRGHVRYIPDIATVPLAVYPEDQRGN